MGPGRYMLMAAAFGLALCGCASEPERVWFTEESGPGAAEMDRLRPYIALADQRAAGYLAEMGYKHPVEGLWGYDRAYMEETGENGRKELTVLYTQRKMEPVVNPEVARFRVVVDQENRKALVVGR